MTRQIVVLLHQLEAAVAIGDIAAALILGARLRRALGGRRRA